MTINTSTEAVEALLKDVTPGPWLRHGSLHNGYIRYCVQAFDGEVDITFQVDERDDANFIAAARELVPALLAERDALKLRAEQAEMREESLKSTIEEARQFLYQRDALKAALADARDMRRIIALFDKGESHE